MVVAVGGVALMVGGPGRPSALGLGLSFAMSVAFAGLLVITRHQRRVSMAPATCLSQVVVLALAGGFTDPGAVDGRDLGLLAALGVGQIGLGLVFLSIGGRLIPAAEVALITLLEVVLGPLWVWIFLSEQPGTAVLAGGAIVLAAVAVQVIYFHRVYRRDGSDRGWVFDAAYKDVYDLAVAQPSRPIYLSDVTEPAYVHALWYATIEGRNRDQFVHLDEGARAPNGAIVIASDASCFNCEIIKASGDYILYRSLGDY
jgi:hypothetical protein